MPTTTRSGTPSAANSTIGGVPTIHYLDFASKGRGQVVRLLCEDAGIAYDDVRYSFEEYPDFKKGKITDLNPLGNVPVVELGGRVLTQSYPILRHWARVLGRYEGEGEEERYWVDVVCDACADWRTLFVQAFFSPTKDTAYPEHQRTTQRHYLTALEKMLTSSAISAKGPYIAGTNFTYADLVLYQVLHDEGLTQDGRKGLGGYERLRELVDAVEGREGVKAFLGSERYRG